MSYVVQPVETQRRLQLAVAVALPLLYSGVAVASFAQDPASGALILLGALVVGAFAFFTFRIARVALRVNVHEVVVRNRTHTYRVDLERVSGFRLLRPGLGDGDPRVVMALKDGQTIAVQVFEYRARGGHVLAEEVLVANAALRRYSSGGV